MGRGEGQAEAGAESLQAGDRDQFDERAPRVFANEKINAGRNDFKFDAFGRLPQFKDGALVPGFGDGNVQLALAREALPAIIEDRGQAFGSRQRDDRGAALLVDRRLQALGGGARRAAIIC